MDVMTRALVARDAPGDAPQADAQPNDAATTDAGADKEGMREYSIQEMKRKFHMRASALRYYEEAGLLGDIARTPNGQRLYTKANIDRMEAIACFKDAGMTIDEIKRFFDYEADEGEHITDMLALLKHRQHAIERQRVALEKAYHHVLRKVRYYSAVNESIVGGAPHPDWNDFEDEARP
jgi:DNA-binding transcriptional MerR regulator